ncbi:MAG: hypothetical protein NUV98_06605 [Candidatus Roizmanbacteria bacterium]|nr:hypothetical protein [Candidatus Roizmanbacteria bacterium]
MKARKISQSQLSQLYKSGKSMKEISQILHCSQNKIVYWMNKYGITRRMRSEAVYIKANPLGDPFNIKQKLLPEDRFLLGLGIGLYWGEGEKVSKYSVRVANTDPYLILTFSRFLKEICRVKTDKMRYSIVCFNDTDTFQAQQYWSKLLGVPAVKFGKIVQIPKQGKGIYKRKSKFGVCTLTVSNMKLKEWIMKEVNKLKNTPR